MLVPVIDGSSGQQIDLRKLVAGLSLMVFQLAALQGAAPPAKAQINIQGEDGKIVRIGPGGIEVHSSRGNTVTVTPGGVNVKKDVPPQVQKRVTIIKPVASSSQESATNLTSMIARLETAAYGKVDAGKPLITRLERLEADNLGKKGTGTNIQRAEALAKALGVTLGETTVVTTHTTPPAARPIETLVITDNHHQGKFKCANSNVSITSNNCKLVLSGTCKDLSVSGNHNIIKADRIEAIQLLGNHNTVTWTKEPAPAVSNVGNYNKILEDDPNDPND